MSEEVGSMVRSRAPTWVGTRIRRGNVNYDAWHIRITKSVRLGTPLERNTLITILANPAAKHYTIHFLLTISSLRIYIVFYYARHTPS